MSLLQKIIRADVQATNAYVVAPSAGMLKLDAMENPQGMPAALLDKLAQQLKTAELNRYPAPKALELEAALRACTAIPKAAHVLFGNGSDELIDLIIRACCMPGDAVLSPVPTFVM
ncbi:MAG: histidinol-phosphate aminotransferase, partial [Betaproteobacteria bacterium]